MLMLRATLFGACCPAVSVAATRAQGGRGRSRTLAAEWRACQAAHARAALRAAVPPSSVPAEARQQGHVCPPPNPGQTATNTARRYIVMNSPPSWCGGDGAHCPPRVARMRAFQPPSGNTVGGGDHMHLLVRNGLWHPPSNGGLRWQQQHRRQRRVPPHSNGELFCDVAESDHGNLGCARPAPSWPPPAALLRWTSRAWWSVKKVEGPLCLPPRPR